MQSVGLSEIELCPLLCLQETSSYKIAARPERRRQFEIDLCSSANVTIDLLTACMAIDQLKEQVYFLFNISFYDTNPFSVIMHKEVVPTHSFFFVQSLAIYFIPTLLHAHVMCSHDWSFMCYSPFFHIFVVVLQLL